jgi:hypothetical protein
MSIQADESLVLVHGSTGLRRLFGVFGEVFLSGFGHQALLLTGVALLPSSLVLLLLGTAVTLPEEDDSLAYKHTNSASSETSENTQNSGDDNEANNARESVSKGTVGRAMHMVRARRTTLRILGVETMVVGPRVFGLVSAEVLKVLERRRRGHQSLGVELVMVLVVGALLAFGVEFIVVLVVGTLLAFGVEIAVVLVVATHTLHALAALHTGDSHDTVLGRRQKAVNTGEEELLQALRLAVALLPGQFLVTWGGLLNVTVGKEQIAGRCEDQSNRNGVNRNGVCLQVEDSESDIKHVSVLRIGGAGVWHDFEGVANGDGARLFVAITGKLVGSYWAWGNGRENLLVIGQQAVVFNVELDKLRCH